VIRTPRPSETETLVQLSRRTGLFTPSEADALLRSTLDALHDGTLIGPHLVRVIAGEADDHPLGWAYAAESTTAPGVWDVWWIGVDPAAHGRGVGTELLDSLEREMRAAKARVVVIETSDGAGLARARRFYPSRGYVERGRIPDFYAPGEAKVIFSKSIEVET
jgi:ribosomal protein S18 acetylase RimI-like enzyme